MPSQINAAFCVAQERISNGMRSPQNAARTAGIGFRFTVACRDIFSNPIGKSAYYNSSTSGMNPADLHQSSSILGFTSDKTLPHSVQRGAGMSAGTWTMIVQQQERAGDYFLSVMTSGGEHISSSPFQIYVMPSNHCAARSFVTGTFLSLYTTNSFCTFSVIARDRFYNKLTACKLWHFLL